MIFIILYLVILAILGLVYFSIQKKYVFSKIKEIYSNIEQMGYDYITAIESRWNKIYKNDKDTRKLLFLGRKKFFSSSKHSLEEIYNLYKSYDFDYLDKLFGEKIGKEEYKLIEQKIGIAVGISKTSSFLRTILLILTLGTIYFIIGDRNYC